MDAAQEKDIRNPRATAIRIADLLIGARWPQPPLGVDLIPDGPLSRKLQAIIDGDPKYRELDVAVVDFSGSVPRIGTGSGASGPQKPAAFFIASMAKIAVLYAAFQLREDVRAAVARCNNKGAFKASTSAQKLTALKSELQAYWKSSSTHLGQADDNAKPGGIKVADRADIARLDRIFDLAELSRDVPNPIGIDFVGIAPAGLQGPGFRPIDSMQTESIMHELDGYRESEDDSATAVQIWNLDFGKRLWMTVAWSSNVAASACICDIGLPYIQALLYDSGLFSDEDGGLYLTRNYKPTPQSLLHALGPAMGRFPVAKGPAQRGSVPSLLTLMIALQQDKLISANASQTMKRLLRPPTYAAVDPPLKIPGDVRLLAALDREPGGGRPPPADAFVKGGSNGEDLIDKTGKPIRSFGIACDWEYFEINASKTGVVILNGTGREPPGHASKAKQDAEVLVMTFLMEAQSEMPALFPP